MTRDLEGQRGLVIQREEFPSGEMKFPGNPLDSVHVVNKTGVYSECVKRVNVSWVFYPNCYTHTYTRTHDLQMHSSKTGCVCESLEKS